MITPCSHPPTSVVVVPLNSSTLQYHFSFKSLISYPGKTWFKASVSFRNQRNDGLIMKHQPNFCRCSTKMESYYGYCHHYDLSLLYWNCLGETWMSRALWAFEWRCNRWFFYDSWGSWAGIKRLKQLNFGTWQTYRTHAQLFRVVLWITRIDWTPICPYPKWRQWTKKHTLQNLPIISIINIRRGMKSDF